MTACNIVWSEAVNLWTCGTYVCIKLPIKTFNLLWETQLFLIYLPFRCAYRILRFVIPSPSNVQRNEHTLLKTIMCCDLSEKQKVLDAFHEIQTSSLKAVNKVNSANVARRKRRRQVSNKEKVTPPQRKLSCLMDGKKINKEMAEQLEQLKSDTAGPIVPNEVLDLSEEDFVTLKERIPSAATNLCKHERLITMSLNNFLKSYCDVLRSQICAYNTKSQCTDTMNKPIVLPSTLETLNNSLLDALESHENDTKTNHNVDKLQTITHLLNAENVQLKEHLTVTNDQLNDIRTTITCLSQKVLGLELQLDKVKDILRSVVADRDTMQEKLMILQQMIEEEEIYLNDDSSRDDSFSDIYVTTQENNCRDLEVLSPSDGRDNCFTESDNESWGKQDQRRSHFSFSR